MAFALAAAPVSCGDAMPTDDVPTDDVPADDALPDAALTATLANSVERGDTPGVVGLVVDGDVVLFEGAGGQLDVGRGIRMPTDAIFALYSMTKPVTSVAAMILVERGQISLDDPVAKFLPRFADRQVITSLDATTGVIETAPPTTVLSVRHLLSHTAGLGYAFCNATVASLLASEPVSELELPLLSEPGAEWHYSPSTRAVGEIVEVVSGQSLEDFFRENIFAPLGMDDTSFAVPADKRARVPTLHLRGPDGSSTELDQDVPSTPTAPFLGDGGLYSTARDYGRFMQLFLNGGSLDGQRILDASTVALMGENQIGSNFVELQRSTNGAAAKDFPLGAGVDQFGLGFQITNSDGAGSSRSAGSLAWAGLLNTEFWIDRQRGIAATLLMQEAPFYDDGAIRALADFEATVYRELRRP
jgi:CubicO group peptidase (beta-lactamase class C family)